MCSREKYQLPTRMSMRKTASDFSERTVYNDVLIEKVHTTCTGIFRRKNHIFLHLIQDSGKKSFYMNENISFYLFYNDIISRLIKKKEKKHVIISS